MKENNLLSFKSVSKQLNDITYTTYFYRLMLIARKIFKWNNLPNGIDEKWIERFLFYEGKCVFFKDKELGCMVAKCTQQGQINNYDEPTKLKPFGTNYNGPTLTNEKDCIIIRNNDDMIPTSYAIQLFAIQLTELTRTIDINVKAQKTPLLIKCSEKQKLALKNVYRDWNENEPVIFGDKNLDVSSFEVLKTDAPIVFDKLQLQKHAIWNECMTFLGINNANQDKKERLVDDEVQANNEQVEYSAQVMLASRQEACRRINKMFGTNISVELRVPRVDILTLDKEFSEEEKGELE